MKGEQMEIFAEQPFTQNAQVIPFPIEREVVLIRNTARALFNHQAANADRFWKSTCRRIYARLQVQGLSERDIKQQLSKFAHSVHSEMQRAAWDGWESENPKGAA